MSQAVFDFYASNEFIEYPFAERQSDGLHELFVDAYLVHNVSNQGRVRIASFNPAGTAELRFEDGSLLVSLTAGDGFISKSFGAYDLYEWRRSSTIAKGFTGLFLVFRTVIVHRSLARFVFPVVSFTSFLNPARVNPQLQRVRSYAVAVPGEECCQDTPGRKSLILEAGFNALIEPAEAPAGEELVETAVSPRNPTRIAFNFDAGSGRGTFPVCEDPTAEIKTIKSMGPDDNGEFKLSSKDCTWDETRLVGGTLPPIHPNTDYLASIMGALDAVFVQLHQGCRACCDCSDYSRAYQLMASIYARAKAVRDKMQDVAAQYGTAKSKWLSKKVQKEVGRKANIRVMARPDFYVDLAFTIANNQTDNVLSATRLAIALSPGSSPTPEYVEGTGYVEAENMHGVRLDPYNAGGGVFSAQLPEIKPGQYAVYRMSVRYTGDSRVGKQVNVYLTAADGGGGNARYEQAQTVLLKPLEKT